MKPPLFDLKIVYSYVIEVADSGSILVCAIKSKIFAFLKIIVTISIENYSTTILIIYF